MGEWHLLIQDDEGAAVAVPLQMKRLTLGRDEENLIRLTQRNVSRQHAIISTENENIELEDLQSANGSFVNGKKIESPVKLGNGDTVQIGDYVLQIFQGDLKQLLEDDQSDHTKTQPGINLAGLSELSVEGSAALPTEVSGTLTRPQMYSWSGLGDGAPDSVFLHPSIEALQTLLRNTGSSGALEGITVAEGNRGQEETQVVQTPLDPTHEPTKIEPAVTAKDRTMVAKSSSDSSAVSDSDVAADAELEDALLPSDDQNGAMLGNVPATATRTNVMAEEDATIAESVSSSTDQSDLLRPESSEEELKLSSEPELTVTVKESVTQPAIPEMQKLPRLVVLNTNLAGKVYPLLDNNITVGRIPQTDFSIIHRSVSRRHARVYREGEQHYVEDLESANGILVDGENKAKVPLTGGEVIELGRVRIRFCMAEDAFALSAEEIAAAQEAEKQEYSLNGSNEHFATDSDEGPDPRARTERAGPAPKRWVFFWPLASSASAWDSVPPSFTTGFKPTGCLKQPVAC